MKRVLSVVAIASVMAAGTAYGLTFSAGKTNNPGDGVVLSKHNMNNYDETSKDLEGRVCAFCHTPHHSLDDTTGGKADYLPLWSHKLTTQVTAQPYWSQTLDGISGVDNVTNTLYGPTILCMSCHDGVIAVDEHYNNGLVNNKLANDNFGGTAVGLANNTNAPGATNLANDHPMGFVYDDAVAAHPGDLNPKTSPYKGVGATKTIEQQLTAGYFTCATCHDVHNKDSVKNTAATSSRNYFLLGDNNGSQFCLSCHIK